MAYALGIDVGTSGLKAILMSQAGRIAQVVEVPYPVESPRPGWTEQSPEIWSKALRKALALLKKARPQAYRSIRSIGLSGQMHGSVFLDKKGKSVWPALLWNDQRTVSQCEAIVGAAGGERNLLSLVNNSALTGYTAPKILWLRENEPSRFAKVAHVILPKDWIALELTGEIGTDVSDASGTLLFDIGKRDWSREMLDKLDLNPRLFPRARESSELVGFLLPEVAKELGLSEQVVVVAGAGDQPAAALGTGVVSEGQVSATLGTSGVVFAALESFQQNTFPSLQVFCSAVEQEWCAFGCMLSAGGALEWFRSTSGEKPNFTTLIKKAMRSRPGANGLVFLPYLDGERCPHPDPMARAGWLGLSRSHTNDDLTRSVIEGITYGMKDQIRLMESAGIAVEEIRSAGGGAKSDFWLQLQADIYAKKVLKMETPHASALGAAILAAVGIGWYRTVREAANDIVRPEKAFTPKRASVIELGRGYERYSSLYPIVRPWFHHTAGGGA